MDSIQAMSSKFFVKLYPINLSQTSKLKNKLTRNVILSIIICFGSYNVYCMWHVAQNLFWILSTN